MGKGPLAASDVAREICGTERVSPAGYCIGGTLMAMTLAALAARGDERFGPATFMVSLVDFADVGDTAFFVDEPQIEYVERHVLERGYLDICSIGQIIGCHDGFVRFWHEADLSGSYGRGPMSARKRT